MPGDEREGFPEQDINAVDVSTGAWVHTATVSAPGEPASACGQLPVAAIHGAGETLDVTATAPGYRDAHQSFQVPSSDSLLTIPMTAACSPLTKHSDGIGDFWFDCEDASTSNATQAASACTVGLCARLANGCGSDTCSAPDGGAAAGVRCTYSGYPGQHCYCWDYAGDAAGHVRVTDGGCMCPATSDPTWY